MQTEWGYLKYLGDTIRLGGIVAFCDFLGGTASGKEITLWPTIWNVRATRTVRLEVRILWL